MREHEISGTEVLFVGDTLHDLEVAKAIDASCMLVCCGHQSKEVLQQAGVPLLASISDLLALV